MSELILICGDMLFADLSGLPPNAPIFMAEDRELCTRSNAHRQRITLFLSAMRHFRDRLRSEEREVIYHELDQEGGFIDKLALCIRRGKYESLHTFEVPNHFFRKMVIDLCSELGVLLMEHPSPMFLTTAEEWDKYRKHRSRLFMADFYAWQRRRLGLLVTDGGNPVGGKWSFDQDNRSPLPKDVRVPEPPVAMPDELTQEVIEIVDSQFPTNPGLASQFGYPVDPEGARAWLNDFLENRLDQFGDYEDAFSQTHRINFHSQLTPMLNTGLLTPREVTDALMKRHLDYAVPFNSLEGFLRQVIGWREFIRGVYRVYGELQIDEKVLGPFGHRRTLKDSWWKADTGLPPLDLVIERARENGYAHHIERLMVVGSAMLMAEVSPESAYRWFMEMFVDAADWVMAPNVIGMSQFADGGLFATKPYLSGSAYLIKMGRFPKGDWCEIWDGLYWRFIQKHRRFFASNPRTSVLPKTLDRLNPDRLRLIVSRAETWIESVTQIP